MVLFEVNYDSTYILSLRWLNDGVLAEHNHFITLVETLTMAFNQLIRQRNFGLYFFSGLISGIGDSIQEIALIWLVYEVTGSPTMMSVIFAATLLPHAICSLPAGSLVDHWNKRRVAVVTEFVRSLAVLSIPLVGNGPYLIPVVILAGGVEGFMQAFFGPARQSLLPDIVDDDDLDEANVLVSYAQRAAQMFYLLGGIFVLLSSSFFAFYVNSLSFFISGVALWMVTIDEDTAVAADTDSIEVSWKGTARRTIHDVRNGFEVIRDNSTLSTIIVINMLLHTIYAPLSVILPVLSEKALRGGGVTYSVLMVALITGQLLGGLFVRFAGEYIEKARGQVITSSVILTGASLWLFALIEVGIVTVRPTFASVLNVLITPSLLVAISGMMLFGLFLSVIQSTGRTLLFRIIPDDRRGFTFATIGAFGSISGPVSIVVAGVIMNFVSPEVFLVSVGMIAFLVGVNVRSTSLSQYADGPVSETG